MLIKEELFSQMMLVAYDDAGGPPAGDPPAGDPPAAGNDDFTPAQQAKVDKMIAEQSNKAKRTMAELDAIKARNDLTAGQRKDLEQRFETVQKELMTKEELFDRDRKKSEKQHGQLVETLTSERDSWQDRYTESKVMRAISDASSMNKAFDNDTIVAILRPKTELIESLNEEGVGTGEFTEKVKFLDPEGKDGKPAELLLSASEAVKRMTELPKYQYLFEGKGTGGLGGNKAAGGTQTNIGHLAKDPKAYREARKAGRI